MKKPSCSHSRSVTMTNQYQGGWVTDSHGTAEMPNSLRIWFISPKRTPEKIDIFQISAATTYEQAVGRKYTERKNPRRMRARCTSSAKPRAPA